MKTPTRKQQNLFTKFSEPFMDYAANNKVLKDLVNKSDLVKSHLIESSTGEPYHLQLRCDINDMYFCIAINEINGEYSYVVSLKFNYPIDAYLHTYELIND
jgi:hypothetical protein